MNSSRIGNGTTGGNTVYPMFIWLGTWELFCGIVGALANGFVLHLSSTLIQQASQDPHHHIYIFSLTLANFIFNVVHCPLMFAHYCLRLPLSHTYCNILYFFTHLSTVAASLSLLWINLNKFLLWKRIDTGDVNQSFLSSNRLLAFIMTAWFVSIGWAFFLILGPAAEFKATGSCQVHLNNLAVYVHFLLVFFLVPISASLLISIYVCYAASAETKRRTLMMALRLEDMQWKADAESTTSSSRDGSVHVSLEDILEDGESPGDSHFVFATTLWSAVSCLPYRIAFICFTVRPQLWLARVTFGLFTLMIANPTVVPFITILALTEYRNTARQLLQIN